MTARTVTLALRHQVEVALPPDEVAPFVLDWRHDPLWRADVEHFTADPPGPATTGQQLVEVLRLAGQRFRTPSRIDARTPFSASWSARSGGLGLRGHRSIEPSATGSRVLVEVDVVATGPVRLVVAALGPAYERRAAADVARIPGVLAGRSVPVAVTGERS